MDEPNNGVEVSIGLAIESPERRQRLSGPTSRPAWRPELREIIHHHIRFIRMFMGAGKIRFSHSVPWAPLKNTAVIPAACTITSVVESPTTRRWGRRVIQFLYRQQQLVRVQFAQWGVVSVHPPQTGGSIRCLPPLPVRARKTRSRLVITPHLDARPAQSLQHIHTRELECFHRTVVVTVMMVEDA